MPDRKVMASYDGKAFVTQDVPLTVADGGSLVEYPGLTMHARDGDTLQRVMLGWVAFDSIKLRKGLTHLFEVNNSVAESNIVLQVHFIMYKRPYSRLRRICSPTVRQIGAL